jgi:hypothetical protein
MGEHGGAGGGLVPCDMCGRSFAPDRIDAHCRACKGGASKPRRVFNAAQQRIGAIEGVTQTQVRAANQEAQAKAKAQAEQRKAPAAVERPAPEPPRSSMGGSRKVMLGKDGRPLSPLSAALARQKAGEDPFDEDPDDIPSDIRPCPCCGRNFSSDRLPKHLEICQKSQLNSQQRGTYNSQSKRLQDSQVAAFNAGNGSPPPMRAASRRKNLASGAGTRGSHTPGEGAERAPSRNAATARSADARSGGFGGGGGGGGGFGEGGAPAAAPAARGDMPANKGPKWKRDRDALKNAMRSGRELDEAKKNGTLHLLPPPPPAEDEYDDRVPCPHCGRKFNANAAERHIPKCSSIRAQPKMLVRGGGRGGGAGATGGRTPTHYVM